MFQVMTRFGTMSRTGSGGGEPAPPGALGPTSRTQTASSTRVSRRASLPDTRASVPGTRALLPGTGVCPPDSGALPSDTRVSFPCGSGPPFLGADSVDPFERRGQGEGGAVADLVGDRGEGGVGVAEAVRGQGETPG